MAVLRPNGGSWRFEGWAGGMRTILGQEYRDPGERIDTGRFMKMPGGPVAVFPAGWGGGRGAETRWRFRIGLSGRSGLRRSSARSCRYERGRTGVGLNRGWCGGRTRR